VEAVAPNIVRIHVEPCGWSTVRTLMMDPVFQSHASATISQNTDNSETLMSRWMSIVLRQKRLTIDVQVKDAEGRGLLTMNNLIAHAKA